jgi:hypothetical protein
MRREDLFASHSLRFASLEAGGMRLEGEGMGLEDLFASFEVPFASCTSELERREE